MAWSIWFSYEIRTASPVLPFVGLIAGFAIARILSFRFPRWLLGASGAVAGAALWIALSAYLYWQTSAGPPVLTGLTAPFHDRWVVEAITLYSPWLLLSALAVLAMSAWRFKKDTVRLWWPELGLVTLALLMAHTNFRWDAILNDQAVRLRRNGIPALNEKLYVVAQERHIHSGIATSYWPLRELPSIGQYFRWPVWYSPCPLPILRAVPLAIPDAGYILIPEGDLDDATRTALMSATDLRTVFVEQGFRMIEIVR
jgi:hypothetical protein